jgi:hypothetical protein
MSTQKVNNKIILSGLKMFRDIYQLGSVIELSNVAAVKDITLTIGRILVYSIFNRRNNLFKRIQLLNNFHKMIIKYNKNHGVVFTISFLKASQLAIQKKLAGSPLSSLREVEPRLPLPRLINGLPPFINIKDRSLINQHSPKVIRLYLTIFGIYRIFKCPPKGQIDTIMNPFSGSWAISSDFNQWMSLYGVRLLRTMLTTAKVRCELQDLEVKSINWLLTSGPVGKVSYKEIFTNLFSLSHNETLLRDILLYLDMTKSFAFKHRLLRMGVICKEMVRSITVRRRLDFLHKNEQQLALFDVSHPIGRLSFKEEANGKVRVFAIIDVITQSLLTPLHKILFKVCSVLPTDSLFDQNLAFERCLKLSKEMGCSYGYDLSAATDRLPIWNQSHLLDELFQSNIGSIWARILINRDFHITENDFNIQNYYNLSNKVRYAVGQPMGALSSWAAMNLVHHMMVQYSAWLVRDINVSKPLEFYLNYQILGDDLVIFDKVVAEAYQDLCRGLGVKINLTKSIISETKPVVEFAKRTGVDGVDVSQLSFKELLSNNNFFGKLSFFNHLSKKGFIKPSKLLNVFKIVNSIQNEKKNEVGAPLVAYLYGNIRKGLSKLRVDDLMPYMNDGKEVFHYFGKHLSCFNRQGLIKLFLYHNDLIEKPKVDLDGEYVHMRQKTYYKRILLLQLLYKLRLLFAWESRYLNLRSGFVDSFGFVDTDRGIRTMERIYDSEFKDLFLRTRDYYKDYPYEIWSVTLDELEKLNRDIDWDNQYFAFYLFDKESKLTKVENPFKDLWFVHLINLPENTKIFKVLENRRNAQPNKAIPLGSLLSERWISKFNLKRILNPNLQSTYHLPVEHTLPRRKRW